MKSSLLMTVVALFFGSGCGRSGGGAKRKVLDASSASYDRYRRPDVLVAALGLRRGDRVADVGAGTGYLTFRLAEAVGQTGRVVATDIDAAALAALSEARGIIETRRVSPGETGLEARGYDVVLVSEVDQLLPDRVDFFRQLSKALKPGGRLAVSNRLPYRQAVLDAASRAGLHPTSEVRELPAQFLLLFKERS